MYLDGHTNKPVHPIVDQIRSGKMLASRLVPRDSHLPVETWIPAGVAARMQ